MKQSIPNSRPNFSEWPIFLTALSYMGLTTVEPRYDEHQRAVQIGMPFPEFVLTKIWLSFRIFQLSM